MNDSEMKQLYLRTVREHSNRPHPYRRLTRSGAWDAELADRYRKEAAEWAAAMENDSGECEKSRTET